VGKGAGGDNSQSLQGLKHQPMNESPPYFMAINSGAPGPIFSDLAIFTISKMAC
jgi:hypothetical protein